MENPGTGPERGARGHALVDMPEDFLIVDGHMRRAAPRKAEEDSAAFRASSAGERPREGVYQRQASRRGRRQGSSLCGAGEGPRGE
eukprot:2940569-Alexandrium_andersonii.AAC.1